MCATSSPPASQRPDHLLSTAISTDSPTTLQAALDLARSTYLSDFPDFPQEALCSILYSGSSALTSYLLTHNADLVHSITPLHIAHKPSIPLFQALLDHGWDPNTSSPKSSFGKGQRVIDHVLPYHELVVWLVEHGAEVNYGYLDAIIDARPSPLLETCAAIGSLATFKYLRERGARLGRRTLHVAVLRAAQLGADPSVDQDTAEAREKGYRSGEERKKKEAEAIVRYLVDEMGLDVNQIELDSPWRYGTPINHAAAQKKGAAVVWWLLQRGADPDKYLDPTFYNIGSQAKGMDAEDFARAFKCDRVLDVLAEWKRLR
ncbi:hypothetical protein CC78DRAFT_303103 [Lojkania enalia]|uniref:Ankyrin n=1 Tax=Lojkania enalia TaxID=147567 RepID=A0A9P4N9I6_9PLEO|nr:hypothetical protein CC78DRAFT_303103 [Didymosphaeria enalia]